MIGRVLAAFAASMLCAPALSAQDTLSQRDMDRLRGTFSLVRGVADGQAMPGMMASQMKRVAEGETTTVTLAGQLYLRANISVDATATPKTIDYDMTGGFTAGKRQLGIYRITGDTLETCFGSPDKPRPRAFESTPGSGVTCTLWKRSVP